MRPHPLPADYRPSISSSVLPALRDLQKRGALAAYMNIEFGANIGQLVFVATGEGGTYAEPPEQLSWRERYIGMLDLDEKVIRGHETYPVEIREDIQVILVRRDKEGSRKILIDPKEEIVIYKSPRSTKRRLIVARVEGWAKALEKIQDLRANSPSDRFYLCIVSTNGRTEKHQEVEPC